MKNPLDHRNTPRIMPIMVLIKKCSIIFLFSQFYNFLRLFNSTYAIIRLHQYIYVLYNMILRPLLQNTIKI